MTLRNQQRSQRRRLSFSLFHLLFTSVISGSLGLYVGLLLGTATSATTAVATDHTRTERYLVDSNADSRFPSSVQSFATGMAVVDRDSLAETLDTGVPLDKSLQYNHQALLLYQSNSALPNGSTTKRLAMSNGTIPTVSVSDALVNCDAVHLILSQPASRRQCVAIMNQYESFHIQKFMRLPESGKLDRSLPLRLVNRGAQANGRKSTKPPSLEDTKHYWEMLKTYLEHFDSITSKVQSVARKVAVQNTIVVLVCNQGQSELLINSICSARYRGISTDHMMVFATDEETKNMMEALGIAVVYDDSQSLPKAAAKRYADATFAKMMLAKVWCVQQLIWLEYNVLFQDVDVIWYKDPLPYFLDASQDSKRYDLYFQDDGNHALYYAPYSANTGFYFVRANDKTRHFFNSMLLAGDLIASTKSHQIPLVALLAEHASMYGLLVHIWNRETDDFPGGHAFHRRKSFMRDLVQGKVDPYILHMSWTTNKNNKVKFFQQLGEWYVGEDCVACCSTTPIFQCHYRDKPSKQSCANSPPIDKGGASFW